MASSIIKKSLQGDLNTLSARAGRRYSDEEEKKTYTFPVIRGYGSVLVLTQYGLWAVHYDGTGAQIGKIFTFSDGHQFVSASFDGSSRTISISDNSDNLWGGIVVYQ
jgi:hypothetical protein